MYNNAYDANYLEISREALEQNAQAVVDYVGAKVIGVVKFNGYGATIAEAAQAWKKAGVTMFAVSESWEALALRQAGFTEDVLLMAPVADTQTLEAMLEQDVILTVSNLENARFYQAHSAEALPRVHVKVDTGMGRFGVRWTDLGQLKEIYQLDGLRFEGIFSHFPKSFEKEYKLTNLQLERFLGVVRELTEAGIAVGMRHIANSCAALRFPETRLDAVRIGSALVGGVLSPVPVSLRPVSTCKALVVDCKTLQKGDTIGYAAVCKIKRPMKAAVVAIGFQNGLGMTGAPDPFPLRDLAVYLYHLLQRYRHPPCAVYDGKTLPLVGRIGSQYTMFEMGDADVQPGDYVTVRVPLLQCTSKRKFV